MKNIQRELRLLFILIFLLCFAASALLAVLRKPQGAEYVLWAGFIFLLLGVLFIPLGEVSLAVLFLLQRMINNLGRCTKNIPHNCRKLTNLGKGIFHYLLELDNEIDT